MFIGNSDSAQYDQLLEDFDVPIESADQFSFTIGAPAPDLNKLPSVEDIFDVSALSIVVLYENKEFFRCSYFLTHRYDSNDMPQQFTMEGLFRHTYTEEPPRIVLKEDFNWEEYEEVIESLQTNINQNDIQSLSNKSSLY